MKITKRQLKRIIREEKEQLLDEVDVDAATNGDHHWPRVDWDRCLGTRYRSSGMDMED